MAGEKIEFSFGMGIKRRTQALEKRAKELFDIKEDDVNNIYFENISNFTEVLCTFDKKDLSRSEAIIAYTILGSLVEAWIVLFLMFYSPEEEVLHRLQIDNKRQIVNVKFNKMIDFITNNNNIECHELFFKNNKQFLERIRLKRNYVHSISKDFGNFNNISIDEHYTESYEILRKHGGSPDYVHLKVDIIKYDVFIGVILNNLEKYFFNKHINRN